VWRHGGPPTQESERRWRGRLASSCIVSAEPLAVVGARGLTLAVLALLPVVAWPGLPQPFSTPKLWLLVIAAIVLAPFAWQARRARARHPHLRRDPLAGHLLPVCWLASWTWSALLGDVVSPEALLLALASGLLAIILVELAPASVHVASALVVGATAVAVVAIGQSFGIDPFALAGWVAPIGAASARLRIYGTLGNPNFVAALLAAAMPLTIALLATTVATVATVAKRQEITSPAAASSSIPLLRLVLAIALALQIAGLVATGSRAGALGTLAAAMTWAIYGRSWRKARVAIAAAGCLVALVAIGVSTARPLAQTLGGRAYIVRVAWPHAWEAPWAGHGPGAFELLYPGWEREAADRAGTQTVQTVQTVAFAGPQQHAHNDYLEALIERGVLGPVTILGVLATCLRNGWRRTRGADNSPMTVGAVAMLAALAAIACVDFPLARPTETMWWWSGVALISLSGLNIPASPSHDPSDA
jgi:putative inorganic carbon (HCO3(-)) transporter